MIKSEQRSWYELVTNVRNNGQDKPEMATIIQPNQYTKPPSNEWHIVRMHSDGAKLCVHQSRMSIA
jgi:hypothetical protein